MQIASKILCSTFRQFSINSGNLFSSACVAFIQARIELHHFERFLVFLRGCFASIYAAVHQTGAVGKVELPTMALRRPRSTCGKSTSAWNTKFYLSNSCTTSIIWIPCHMNLATPDQINLGLLVKTSFNRRSCNQPNTQLVRYCNLAKCPSAGLRPQPANLASQGWIQRKQLQPLKMASPAPRLICITWYHLSTTCEQLWAVPMWCSGLSTDCRACGKRQVTLVRLCDTSISFDGWFAA